MDHVKTITDALDALCSQISRMQQRQPAVRYELGELWGKDRAAREALAAINSELETEKRHHSARDAAAVRTLAALGYSWRGGEQFAPPIGKSPDFNLLDEKEKRIAELEAQLKAIGAGGVESLRKGGCLHQIAEPQKFTGDSEMRRAFEIEYGQSWADPDWRKETSIWASAWHKATASAQLAAVQQEVQPIGYIHPQNIDRLNRGESVAIRKHGWDGEPGQLAVFATHPTQQGLADLRWQIVHDHISGEYIAGRSCFVVQIPALPGANIMRGSVAEHFTKAVDAIAAQANQGGA